MNHHVASGALSAPDEKDDAIDLAHLRRMTLENRDLEAEILGLFAAQAATLADDIRAADGEATPAALHTIKGSARGIGAHAVAREAEAAERATMPAERAAAIARLSRALTDVGAEIVRLGIRL